MTEIEHKLDILQHNNSFIDISSVNSYPFHFNKFIIIFYRFSLLKLDFHNFSQSPNCAIDWNYLFARLLVSLKLSEKYKKRNQKQNSI